MVTWNELEELQELQDRGIRIEFKNIHERFDGMEARFDRVEANMEARFEGVDRQFDTVNQRFNTLDQKLDNRTELLQVTSDTTTMRQLNSSACYPWHKIHPIMVFQPSANPEKRRRMPAYFPRTVRRYMDLQRPQKRKFLDMPLTDPV